MVGESDHNSDNQRCSFRVFARVQHKHTQCRSRMVSDEQDPF